MRHLSHTSCGIHNTYCRLVDFFLFAFQLLKLLGDAFYLPKKCSDHLLNCSRSAIALACHWSVVVNPWSLAHATHAEVKSDLKLLQFFQIVGSFDMNCVPHQIPEFPLLGFVYSVSSICSSLSILSWERAMILFLRAEIEFRWVCAYPILL